ncbi:hypothetical protein AB0758_47285 [Tolypothrix bouteillei VB521301_2]|uniref:hypothetical protein n=1 Tax=Tolypothrix bouteillei TaxID=1246981 RepID=UPI0038B61637
MFQELGNEVAAICTGGAAYLYKDDGYKGQRLTFTEGTDDLHWYGFNDETSSIQINRDDSLDIL